MLVGETDWALELLGRYEDEQAPSFLHLACQAPHDPLQPSAETLEKYAGTYDEGYAAIREA